MRIISHTLTGVLLAIGVTGCSNADSEQATAKNSIGDVPAQTYDSAEQAAIDATAAIQTLPNDIEVVDDTASQ